MSTRIDFRWVTGVHTCLGIPLPPVLVHVLDGSRHSGSSLGAQSTCLHGALQVDMSRHGVDTARIDSEMGGFEAPSQLRHGFRLHVCALGGRGIIKSDVFLKNSCNESLI